MKAAHFSLEKDFSQRELLIKEPDRLEHLAALIDHTLLKMNAVTGDFKKLVREAMDHQFCSVCIPSSAIEIALAEFKVGSPISTSPLVCTVVGFPHGNTTTDAKICETTAALEQGADEFDFVQNVTWARDHEWNRLKQEAEGIVRAAQGRLVKVILETSLLSDEEIFMSASAAADAGVHVLKTSTGFGTRGASENDLKILSDVIVRHQKKTGLKLGLKASGGVRSLADAMNFIRCGATRLGTSSGALLLKRQSTEGESVY
ncbi:MAG: hypothetical protein RIR26_1135 [Pseudomonadota bacterium]